MTSYEATMNATVPVHELYHNRKDTGGRMPG